MDIRLAYPLLWPEGWPRNKNGRKDSRFRVTLAVSRQELLQELSSMSGVDDRSITISSNVALRNDGLPRADGSNPSDPGVAVYFTRKGSPMVLACDTYGTVDENIRAVGKTVEALRSIERHGVTEMLERAFKGFKALPAAGGSSASCWDALGVPMGSTVEDIETAFKTRAMTAHPDRGGTADLFHRLVEARKTALSHWGK